MRLREGQPAPNFEFEDITGRRISLADYRGSKVLLSFYRAAVCPLCNLRAWHLVTRYDAYRRAGMACVAFFESSPQRTHDYLDRMKAPFPIVADLERHVYGLYGMESSLWGAMRARLFRGRQYHEAAARHVGGGSYSHVLQIDGRAARLPADFLIGADLRIERAYYGRDVGDFLLFSEIDQFAGVD